MMTSIVRVCVKNVAAALAVPAAPAVARMMTPRRFSARPQRVAEPSMISIDEDIRLVGMPSITFEPIYRVMLHFTQWSDNKEVSRRIVRGVPLIGLANAMRIVESAVSHGTSIVITAPLDDAQMYQNRLTQMGLRITLEMA